MTGTIVRDKKTLREKLLEMLPMQPVEIKRRYYTPVFRT